ncbi:hypothetical protein RRG08_052166 [Elysia crispata]|uniref:Uncharacterized protein n=1 Tax=Elysia crispata TaxID=231223 RepID=A0AAE1D0L8_9GAST|nr:hypothetical protein RRG08_052166 [Elysia crispata]
MKKDQDIKVNFIVELNNTLETRFYCSGLQSRLQDCPLDGCVEGGLLWIDHLSNDDKPLDEIYEFENYTLDQINSDQLSERLIQTTKSCPQDGGHKFQICFVTRKADNEAESDSDACLTWGSDNLNESFVNTTSLPERLCESRNYKVLTVWSEDQR